MNDYAYMDAQKLWDYMSLNQPAVSADMLLVLGSIDERVAAYAAELSWDYDYSLVVFSEGMAHGGDLLETTWDESEAEHFHGIFKKWEAGQSGPYLKHQQKILDKTQRLRWSL